MLTGNVDAAVIDRLSRASQYKVQCFHFPRSIPRSERQYLLLKCLMASRVLTQLKDHLGPPLDEMHALEDVAYTESEDIDLLPEHLLEPRDHKSPIHRINPYSQREIQYFTDQGKEWGEEVNHLGMTPVTQYPPPYSCVYVNEEQPVIHHANNDSPVQQHPPTTPPHPFTFSASSSTFDHTVTENKTSFSMINPLDHTISYEGGNHGENGLSDIYGTPSGRDNHICYSADNFSSAEQLNGTGSNCGAGMVNKPDISGSRFELWSDFRYFQSTGTYPSINIGISEAQNAYQPADIQQWQEGDKSLSILSTKDRGTNHDTLYMQKELKRLPETILESAKRKQRRVTVVRMHIDKAHRLTSTNRSQTTEPAININFASPGAVSTSA
ncbi:hypothetical protein BZG36_03351 [Bifiguratus adelaidae]|uniref:Uncharacterized protein n=1 Tax=Bifiguratus adelaidae TaxID=1938954 RepID=A0A261XWN5_9FUNG|nr:hypothetical protein BZG36_03351 [Bifiguratus adelaidae]